MELASLTTSSHSTVMGTDIAMDFIMLVIPVPVILKLQMSQRTKVLTLLTFMVGALYGQQLFLPFPCTFAQADVPQVSQRIHCQGLHLHQG